MTITSAVALAFGFAPSVEYAAGDSPLALALADFTDDGTRDLAVALNGQSSISLLEGNSDGSFESSVPHFSGGGPVALAAADFDRDHRRDLAVVNSGDNSVSVLEGKGSGDFKPPVPYGIGEASFSQCLAIADLNHDGRRDLAIANGSDNDVSILMGRANGTFKSSIEYPTPAGEAVSIAIGDFDRNGKLDLSVAHSTDLVSILSGKAGGGFKQAVEYPVGPAPGGSSSPTAIGTADFDDDGKRDIAVANGAGRDISILEGKANGTFKPAVDYPVEPGSFPRSLAIGDIDGDGEEDLVVGNQDMDDISVLAGGAGATFGAAQDFPVGDRPRHVLIGNFDHSGTRDLAIANENDDNVSLLLNDG